MNNVSSQFNPGLTVQELCTVDYRADDAPEAGAKEMQSWKDRKLNNRVIAVEKCARQLYMGAACEFEGFVNLQPTASIKTGRDAYSDLLQFMLGFGKSNQSYDPAAKGRFMEGWMQIGKRNPDLEKLYRPVLAKLTTDSSIIDKLIGPKIQTERPWVIAREFSGQKPGELILILGDFEENSRNLSALTRKIALSVNGNGELRPTGIGFSHPAEQVTLELGRRLKEAYKKEGLEPNFYEVPHSELSLAFEMHDRVFVTREMGRHAQGDIDIIEAWHSRENTENTLTHLARAHRDNRDAEKIWNDAQLDNFTGPVAIQEMSQQRQAIFESVREKTLEAIEIVADMRARNQVPKTASIAPLFKTIKAGSVIGR
tara:strand:+ start:718 stop:1827 length:1110 start_codon:yes stop_codon:yes gene_type:complete